MSALRRPLLLLAALLALAQGGCMLLAAGAVGGGAAAYGVARGTVRRTYDASVEQTAAASQSALQDLGLPVERPRVGKLRAEIDSTLPDGGPVLLTLRHEGEIPPTDPKTRVEVHVKVFGDKKLSARLLDQIEHRLKNPAPPPPPLPAAITPTSGTAPPPPLPEQTDEPGLAPAKP